jgi:cobalamin biosynthetic protein CobC
MTGEWTWHGGNLAAAKQRFGGDRPWIDLSTGINPLPWPGATSLEIDWQRLPEACDIARLETVAAAHFGVDARHVCAVPGTEIGLRLAGRMIGGGARHVAPSYRTHGEMFVQSAAISRHNMSDHPGTIILANPNNPDGHILEPVMLRRMLDHRDDKDWLLVDEAYADCDPAFSIAADVTTNARLIVFRSFGKLFGLAGVRLGFVLGPNLFLAALRAALGAWPVSAAAVAIGTAAYADTRWITETRRHLIARSAALDNLLAEAGYSPMGGCPLFRLIETDDAPMLFERLARHAILTRPFTEQPRWLRLGLPPSDAARERLRIALADG